MQLHDVHQGIKKHKQAKRVGRGTGSGSGKTSSKGHKGHSSRQGFKQNPVSEGGQMPLVRRVPKRGFNNGPFRKDFAILNVSSLQEFFEAGAVVDEAALRAAGLVKGRHDDGVKILGDGELTKPMTVRAHKFSQSAVDKIVKAGGTTETVAK
ncbi:MAG: 50S ribosomal protein L15 [Isosphaeraceae bacterium]